MNSLLWAAMGINDMWYALPLVIVVSLVYSATRYEATGLILNHAARTAVWILGFMAVVFVVLLLITWWL